MAYNPPRAEPIAIIGSSCRFAGGVSKPSELWELLQSPIDLSRKVPIERFNVDAFFHSNGEYHGTTDSPKAYFLDQDHRVFDATFFNITPKEAAAIDPQQRMLLEVVYEALESAGYCLRDCSGKKVAVFAGVMTGDYDTLSQRDELYTSQYYATGNARSILSNRISYFFNWNGPSMTIDTACSSSLVALHQAVLCIRSGECEMACVAGANLILVPEQFIVESSLHMLSPSGHCRMWDNKADGYARGEGIVAVFLKPLSKAIRDGDRIEAIIRETGVNSDGRTQGITMPNWEAQSHLIQDTYKNAGLDPRSETDRCQYFEAHGTGTRVGDPNEAHAIEDAFFSQDPHVAKPKSRLLVGSIKTIIGHTEGAAGLAGLLKVVLSMQHSAIPPNLHFEELNPEVAKYYSHLRIPTSCCPWPTVPSGQPKRGSVNSFGFGGTNAHAIIEEFIPDIHIPVAKTFCKGLKILASLKLKENGIVENSRRPCLPLLISAPSPKALTAVAKSYRDYILAHPEIPSEDIAWHSVAYRTHFPFRASVSGLSSLDMIQKLEELIKTGNCGTRAKDNTRPPKILGIFTGQGVQWAAMSRSLLRASEAFASTIRELDSILQSCPHPPHWTLEEEILADPEQSHVDEAHVSQPLCSAVQIALVKLLRDMGITFHTVVGHSSGEIAAAYAAGKLSMRDAIIIAHYRGMGVNDACGKNGASGAMLAVIGLNKQQAEDLCS